jgi:Tfp pilus assembly protein PilF
VLDSAAASQVRITTLRKRWDADRTSSAFLPLAEEYRRLGRFGEAIEALEAGLKVQPSYLSAQVALGRCRLEGGDAAGAVAVLERVVTTDPTQLVANKLLIEAHLQAGRPGDALHRLNAYSALNDRDPDLVGLRQRVGSAGRADPSARREPLSPPPLFGEAAPPPQRGSSDGDLFPLTEIPTSVPDLSDLWTAEPRVSRRSPPETPLAVRRATTWPSNGDDLFPGLASPSQQRQYLAGLLAEGIFAGERTGRPLGAAVPVPEIAAGVAPAESVVTAVEPPPPFAEWRQTAAPPVAVTSEEEAPPPTAAAPSSTPAVASVDATVTLGELYLDQGHSSDAAEIFSAVLGRDPANVAARSGLAQAQSAASLPTAPALFSRAALPEGVTARKIHMLRAYLEGIRRGAQRDVS